MVECFGQLLNCACVHVCVVATSSTGLLGARRRNATRRRSVLNHAVATRLTAATGKDDCGDITYW